MPMGEQVRFWAPLMKAPSHLDTTPVSVKGPVLHDLCRLVSATELEKTLGEMTDSSAGVDQVDRPTLRNVDRESLRYHMNLWLVAGTAPVAFRDGYTTLAEKDGERVPANHRPITVSSFIARCYHKILAARLMTDLPLSPRQKAFMKGDGLADNVWLLRSVVRHSKGNKRPLFVGFVDVAKAFDSVSRLSILKAAARLGVPNLLLSYIQSLYENDTTRLKVRGTFSRKIHVLRGVRQGDPLSPLLFNAVMDWVLSNLDEEIWYDLGTTLLNHLAFADDVALLSSSKCGLIRLSSQFESALESVGLTVNTRKSATMAIVADGKNKRWL